MLKAILFNDTSHNKHHGCQIVVRQIYALAEAAGIRILKSCPMRHDWRTDNELRRHIAWADLCLINGEGTLHDDARAARMLVELAPFCRSMGVPCFLINSVWQRNSAELVEAARSFTRIYLRDRHSQAELANAGVESEVVPDLTLSATPPPSTLRREGLLINGSFYEDRTQEAWRLYRDSAGALEYLSIQSMPQIQVGKGFPRHFWRSLRSRFKALRARHRSGKMVFERELPARQIKFMRWRHCAPTAGEFMGRLAASKGVLTGRFHCVTLCLLTETPFFAIASNTHKIEGLLDQCGLTGRIFADYTTAFEGAARMAFSEEEKLAVRRFVAESGERARAMFVDIAQAVTSRHA